MQSRTSREAELSRSSKERSASLSNAPNGNGIGANKGVLEPNPSS